MNFGLSDLTLEKIKNVLVQFPEVEQASIFGSRAKGNNKNGSDIDIAIYGDEVTESIALDINVILNEEKPFPYYFDIVCYPSLKNVELKYHIDRVGKIFYKKQSA
jgi:predicted nucleotidyltransferase